MKFALSFLILSFTAVSTISLTAAARGENRRGFSLFGGAGLSRLNLSITDFDNNSKSSFTGWGAEAEGGASLHINGRFGSQLSAHYGRSEIINAIDSTTYAERGFYDQMGIKGGFYFANLALGAGYRQVRLDLTSIPSAADASKFSLKGNLLAYFGSFSFDYRDMFRAQVEVSYENGDLEGRKVEAYQGGLKMFLLFDL